MCLRNEVPKLCPFVVFPFQRVEWNKKEVQDKPNLHVIIIFILMSCSLLFTFLNLDDVSYSRAVWPCRIHTHPVLNQRSKWSRHQLTRASVRKNVFAYLPRSMQSLMSLQGLSVTLAANCLVCVQQPAAFVDCSLIRSHKTQNRN